MRLWRAGLTGTTNVIAQGFNIAVNLISVPLTVHYLGAERYGLWMTMSSFLAWLSVADLGLRNSLVNYLAEANGLDNRQVAVEAVATAFWVQAGLALVFCIIAALAIPYINWHAVFNVSQQVPRSELRWGMGALLACFILSIPAGIVPAIYLGYQEGYINNLWLIAASLLSLLALLLVTRHNGGMPELILALSGIRVLVTIANGIYLFFKDKSWLRPKLGTIRLASLKRLLSTGGMYVVAQLSGACMFSSQAMIISQFSGPGHVGPFTIAYRLLTLPQLLIILLTAPLLPAYGEAKTRGDWHWVRKVLYKSAWLTIFSLSPFVLLIALFAKDIIIFWAGQLMVPDNGIIIWLTIYAILGGVAQIFSVMLFGIERVGLQALVSAVTAIFTVVSGMALTKCSGPPGMALGMTIGIMINLTLMAIACRKSLR